MILQPKFSLILLLFACTSLWRQSDAQNINLKFIPKEPDSLIFNLFSPTDSLGSKIFALLEKYEKYGHLGAAIDGYKNNTYLNEFTLIFDSNATLPDDLTDSKIHEPKITIAKYKAIAKQTGFQPYVLIIERNDSTIAKRQDESNYYYTEVRIFKLFNSKAIIGAAQKHGVIYTMRIKLNKDASELKVTEVKLVPEEEFFDFTLGKYGRHLYSAILVSNDLQSLTILPPSEMERKSIPTKSNIFFRCGYLTTSFMQPEALRNNLNENYIFQGAEHGISASISYQKAFGRKGRFGLLLGVEYEQNAYDFTHSDASFVYTKDQNGNSLVDLEGTTYDKKFVDVQNYSENGSLKYIKPEVGLFFNLSGKHLSFQLTGSVGNAFLRSSSYSANSIVSYKGQKNGFGDPISEDALGFYSNLQTDFKGNHSHVQNYFFYKAGAGLDLMLSQRFAISFLFEYRNSFKNIMEENAAELMFLNPDSGVGYVSQFNSLSNSRRYNALAFQLGFKIFLNEKK